MSADAATARHLETPPRASPHAGSASAGPNGASAEAKKRNASPPEFPIRLGLNITKAMAASLARMHKRLRLKEAVIGRLAVMQYLAANDPQYREE
jgi:hypothetical protein